MTGVTIKVLPRPETEQTLLIRGLEPGQGVAAMTAAMGSWCDGSGAGHLPADVAVRAPAGEIAGGAITALRLEGFSPSVAERMRMLEALMQPFGELASTDEALSRRLWTAIRDVERFAADGPARSALEDERALWRVSTAPSRGAEFAAIVANAADAHIFYDWAGGLIWLTLDPGEDAGAALLRRAVAATGGHPTLIPAPPPVPAPLGAFPPHTPAGPPLTHPRTATS